MCVMVDADDECVDLDTTIMNGLGIKPLNSDSHESRSLFSIEADRETVGDNSMEGHSGLGGSGDLGSGHT